MSNFIEELKRRKVFRVSASYAVVAWIIMQIGEVTFPALRLPDWVLTAVVVTLLIGFPIVAIIAWIFDKTPDGIVRTQSLDSDQVAATTKVGNMEVKVDTRPFYLQKKNIFLLLGVIAGILIGQINFFGSEGKLVNYTGDRIPVAIADFENNTNDASLDGLSGLLITSLEQSNYLSVLTKSRMFDLLKQIGKSDIVTVNEELTSHYEVRENLLAVNSEFNMMNILTSKSNVKTLDHQMLNIWRLAYCFNQRSWFRYPEKLCLSGTPLNEAIVSLHQILPKFQKENRVEKTQCIILTDGEASYLPYHKVVDRSWMNSDESAFLGSRNVRPGRTFLRDRKVGKTYGFQYDYHEFTDVLLKNIKDKFSSTNFIGIRVLPNREANRFMRLYYPSGNEKLSNDWKKNKSFTIKNSGYDAYFAMSATSLADDPEFEVKEDATKAQIKKAFVKSLKTKKLNKKVLGEFISLVA